MHGPTSLTYSPTSPGAYDSDNDGSTSPTYSPGAYDSDNDGSTSPTYSPTSPTYSPTSPAASDDYHEEPFDGSTSPTYEPIDPDYKNRCCEHIHYYGQHTTGCPNYEGADAEPATHVDTPTGTPAYEPTSPAHSPSSPTSPTYEPIDPDFMGWSHTPSVNGYTTPDATYFNSDDEDDGDDYDDDEDMPFRVDVLDNGYMTPDASYLNSDDEDDGDDYDDQMELEGSTEFQSAVMPRRSRRAPKPTQDAAGNQVYQW